MNSGRFRVIYFAAIFFLSTLTSTGTWFYTWLDLTETSLSSDLISIMSGNILLWLCVFGIILRNLHSQKQLNLFINRVRNQRILLILLLFLFFSIFWSISPVISAYKFIILFLATITGGYIGFLKDDKSTLLALYWFGIIVIFLSGIFVYFLPGIGTMLYKAYGGAWRGIFWHKNYLGCILALFNFVFLLRMATDFQKERKLTLPVLIPYLISLIFIGFTKSVTGYILTFVLNVLLLFFLFLVHFGHRFKKWHYYLAGFVFLFILTWSISNPDQLFSLVNRSPSLTGRVPMWQVLFQEVIARNPWVGYGYGSLWSLGVFRSGVSDAVNWFYPVMIGDNGFIDLILSIGIIGLIIFLILYVQVWINSIKCLTESQQIIQCFPLIFLVFVTLANISFSMLIETDLFTWVLLVFILFRSNNFHHFDKQIKKPAIQAG